MIEVFGEGIVLLAVILVVFIAIGGFLVIGGKLLPALVRCIVNFVKWQLFKRKKDDFDSFDDFSED